MITSQECDNSITLIIPIFISIYSAFIIVGFSIKDLVDLFLWIKVQENIKYKNFPIRDITKEQNVYSYKETNNKAYLYWYLPHWYGLHWYKPNIGMNKLIVLIVNMLLKYIYIGSLKKNLLEENIDRYKRHCESYKI